MPASRSASARPAASGASGPTTTRSTRLARARARRAPAASSAATSGRQLRDVAPCRRCPGAASTRSTRGLRAIFQASACSRPPEPIRRTRTRHPPQCRKWRTPVKQHRDAEPIGRGDHLGVAHRAAGLHHRARARRAAASRPSGNGKKASLASAEPASAMPTRAAFATACVDRVDARGRAAADRERAVRAPRTPPRCSSRASRPPGEARARGSSASSGLRCVATCAVARSSMRDVGLLHQQAAVDAAHVELGRRRCRSGWKRSRRRFFFLREQRERVGVEARRDQHLGEDLVDRARERQVEGPVRDDDAAEGRLGIGARRRAGRPRAGVAPSPTPHGVLCFRIATAVALAARIELEDQRERRLRVDEVVVRELLAVQRLGDLEEARRRARRAGAGSRRSGASRRAASSTLEARREAAPRRAPRARRRARRGSRCRSARCARRPSSARRRRVASPRAPPCVAQLGEHRARSRRDRRRTPT